MRRLESAPATSRVSASQRVPHHRQRGDEQYAEDDPGDGRGPTGFARNVLSATGAPVDVRFSMDVDEDNLEKIMSRPSPPASNVMTTSGRPRRPAARPALQPYTMSSATMTTSAMRAAVEGVAPSSRARRRVTTGM